VILDISKAILVDGPVIKAMVLHLPHLWNIIQEVQINHIGNLLAHLDYPEGL
jgi:hypothetical protein